MPTLDELNTLNHYIRIYDNAIPDLVLKKFLKICNQSKSFSNAKIYGGKPQSIVDKKIRDTEYWLLANGDEEKSLTTVHWCNVFANMFKFFLNKYIKDTQIEMNVVLQEIQVLKYGNDGHYDFHIDHATACPRTLSCIFLLNEDYEGGELVFGTPNKEGTSVVEKKANRILVWPSNFLYPHAVKSVTSGTRYSIVSWAL